MSKPLPKITLVTPVLNAARYLEQTILSVVNQNYSNLEYIIVDGGSTDGTLEIIQKYKKYLNGWVSAPDRGLYDAINKGFARSNGEIMSWISGTDMLHPNALFVIADVFQSLPHVEWVTGRVTWFDEKGTCFSNRLQRWSRARFFIGANKYIQQESTFWRRRLWDRAGGYVSINRANVGDFELWLRFFRSADLYTVNARVGGYRFHDDALANQDRGKSDRICDESLEEELGRVRYGDMFKLMGKCFKTVERIPFIGVNMRRSFYNIPFFDWKPVIKFKKDQGCVLR
jgi:glycosyltransferase involved in cell wall biosynthesis